MFERFTKRARAVVGGAFEVAEGAGAADVRPEHLLTAILRDEDCLATRVLSDLGADPASTRADLERRGSRYLDGLDDEDAEALATIGIDLDAVVRRVGDEGRSRRRRPKISRTSKKALELSLREAVALRHNYIGTEHLLLGLVRGGDKVVLDTLAAAEITPAGLRAAVADAVRRAS